MNKVTRKEKILKNLSDRLGFSDQDVAWFTKALDPFHDVPIHHLRGYPDGSPANVIVQTIKKSVTIERNSLLSNPDATWGCLLKFDDHLVTEDAITGTLEDNVAIYGSFTNATQYGGLTQTQFTTTSSLPIWRGTRPSGGTSTNVIVDIPDGSADDKYVRGRGRLISRGLEIHNTTAEIDKQGTITSFQMPSTINSEAVVLFTAQENVSADTNQNDPNKTRTIQPSFLSKATTTSVFATTFRTSRMVQLCPSTIAEAVSLPKSVQWEAKDGAMLVQTQNSMENPMTTRDFATVILMPDESLFPQDTPLDVYLPVQGIAGTPGGYGIATTGTVNSEGANATVTTYNLTFDTNKRVPFTTTGIILSGLSPKSTFNVNWVEVYERAPSWSEKDLVVMAWPTIRRNTQILELYSKVVSKLPTAVPVYENGLGDWFVGVVDSVVNTVSSIGKPLMGAITGYQNVRNEQMGQPAQAKTYVDKPTMKKIEAQEANEPKQKKAKIVLQNVPKMPELPRTPKLTITNGEGNGKQKK